MQASRKLIMVMAGLSILSTITAQDERVHLYMNGVSEQFKTNESYEVRMDYIREDIMQESSYEGEGTIWMKGLHYKMVIEEYIIYFDGEKLYSQNTDTEEVYVSTPDPNDPGYLEAVPIRAIKAYQQDFKYQFMGERIFKGSPQVEIQLYPLDVNGPYSMLKMFIHPKTLELEAFVLKHKEGINYTMILTLVRGGQKLEDSTFRFDPTAYPNTEIIELID
ncbi:MAG: outer membrane lipoprotein carrier protein LolA [Bacteroidetes bacterium]|nr:outer membrane lipoprotein carrier protein LolA [Bacteroidota bacterium]